MNNNQTISLIIPAYNEEKYLGACLEATIKNSGGDFLEIIVVDNASTDNTAAIAGSYPNVKVVREERKGLTKARQAGFKASQGEILAYIDADTQMPPNWSKLAKQEFEQNPKLAALSGPYIYYDSTTLQKLLVKLYWYTALPLYWLTGYMIVGGNFLISRKALEQMGGFNTAIEFYGEDTDIARRASKFGRVKFNLKLVMPTSARRLKGQGFLKTALIYATNFFSQALLHRSSTQKYTDLR